MKIYFAGAASQRGSRAFIKYIEAKRKAAGIRRRMYAFTPDPKLNEKVVAAFVAVYKGERRSGDA